MSIYLMSDIHGDLERFHRALERIQFHKEKDHLYILGDVIDRGKYGMEMLSYAMANQEWLHLLLGNHEMFLRNYLNPRNDEERLERFVYETYQYGGKPTLEKIDKMSFEEKYKVAKFLWSLPLYEIIDTPKGKMVLTHSGLDADHLVEKEDKISIIESIEAAYEYDEFEYLISCDIHHLAAGQLKRLDYPMIIGHYPCRFLNEDGSNKIYHGLNYMCIDGGCGYPEDHGQLAVYRLEDEAEWYV